MKRLQTLLTIALLAVGMIAYGQSYTFRVLANKGANQIKSGDTWVALKTGASLKGTDEIKVSDNAYLGLMHSGGKTLEWKEAGTFKVSDIATKVPQGSSVASKYADFLAKKMTAEAQKNRLSATGAVTRAIEVAPINIYAPTGKVSVHSSETVLRWDPLEADGLTYTVTVTNMMGEELLSEETSETHFNLNMKDERITKAEFANVVMVQIKTSEDESIASKEIAIEALDDDKNMLVNEGLESLMSDIDSESALNKYILAGFYEENNLLMDALTNYEAAIELAPDVSTFKEAYDDFLIRNQFKRN